MSLCNTWKIFCSSGTLFIPMKWTAGPASETTLVGEAKIIEGTWEGTAGFSPCQNIIKDKSWNSHMMDT